MSYDIAVFEGDPPTSHKAGLAAYLELMGLLERDDPPAPTPRIVAFVDELGARWPGATDEEFESSPWAGWPLINDAVGPILYTGVAFSRADEVTPLIAEIAARHGLSCFDPQSERLLVPELTKPASLWGRLLGS